MTQLLLHDNMLGTRRQGEMNRTFIYELMIIYFHYLLSTGTFSKDVFSQGAVN